MGFDSFIPKLRARSSLLLYPERQKTARELQKSQA